MDFKALKEEITKEYLDEYKGAIEKENFFGAVRGFFRGTAVGCFSGMLVGIGVLAVGVYTGNAEMLNIGGKIALALFGGGAVGEFSKNSMTLIAHHVAKRNLNKDIKNGKLLDRYKNEIIPQKKKVLRAEASAEVKAFNQKKEARKQAKAELDAVVTMTTDDFKNAFNKVSFKQRVKNFYYKSISVTPVKKNKKQGPQA